MRDIKSSLRYVLHAVIIFKIVEGVKCGDHPAIMQSNTPSYLDGGVLGFMSVYRR